MKLTPEEIATAKAELAKMRQSPSLSEEDKLLMAKYPRHTLEQAREINSTQPSVPRQHPGQDLGFVSGFDRIVAQERGNFHLGGDHT